MKRPKWIILKLKVFGGILNLLLFLVCVNYFCICFVNFFDLDCLTCNRFSEYWVTNLSRFEWELSQWIIFACLGHWRSFPLENEITTWYCNDESLTQRWQLLVESFYFVWDVKLTVSINHHLFWFKKHLSVLCGWKIWIDW